MSLGNSGDKQKEEVDKRFAIQRIVILAGIVIIYFLQSEIRFLPSPLMAEFAADFQVPLTTVGNLLSVSMVAAAVCMFVVSVTVEKLGSVNLLIVGALTVAFSGCMAYAAKSFQMALIAYLFCGICQGIMECIGMVLVAQLFDPGHRAFFCGIICAVAQFTSSIAYSLPIFLEKPLGGWRKLVLLWGLLALAAALLLFLFGGRKTIGRENKPAGKERPGIVKAARIRFISFSVAAMVIFIWVNNHYAIYLPAYLTKVKGFSKEQAGLATSLMYICGFAGALVVGAFGERLRKQVYRYAPVLMLIGGLSLCFLKSAPGILISAGMFGFAYQMWIPMAMASFMNLDGVTTAVLAGATALFNGTGHFLTGFIPAVFTFKLKFMSMNTGYLMVASLLVIPVLLTAAASRLKEFQ